MSDQRIEALRETANDDCEYSGWRNLAQGALDVIAERDRENERLVKLGCRLLGERESLREDVRCAVRRFPDPRFSLMDQAEAMGPLKWGDPIYCKCSASGDWRPLKHQINCRESLRVVA